MRSRNSLVDDGCEQRHCLHDLRPRDWLHYRLGLVHCLPRRFVRHGWLGVQALFCGDCVGDDGCKQRHGLRKLHCRQVLSIWRKYLHKLHGGHELARGLYELLLLHGGLLLPGKCLRDGPVLGGHVLNNARRFFLLELHGGHDLARGLYELRFDVFTGLLLSRRRLCAGPVLRGHLLDCSGRD